MNQADIRNLFPAFALSLLLFVGRSVAGPDTVMAHLPGRAASERFDLHTASGLTNLINAAEALIQLSAAAEEQRQVDREKMRGAKAVSAMSHAELKQYFSEPDGFIARGDRRGLKAIQQLAGAALETNDPIQREHLTAALLEIA